jgi:predicted amidophosphoribosyltransferase
MTEKDVIAGIFFVIVFVMPLWLFVAYRGVRLRRERRRNGLCVNCGYDVRASGSRCSECGEEISN